MRASGAAQIAGILAAVGIANYLRTGKMTPKGVPIGGLYLHDDKDGNAVYSDVADLIGARGAMRVGGLDASLKARPGEVANAAGKQALSTWAGPALGPIPTFGIEAMTGVNPHGIYSLGPGTGPGKTVENIKQGAKQLNPLVANLTSENTGISAQLGKFAPRTVSPYQQKLGTHLGQLAAEARAADPVTFKAPQTPEERQTKQAEDSIISDLRAGKPGAKEAVKALPSTSRQKAVTERAAYVDDNAHAILTQPLPALATAYQKMTPAERAQPAHAINAGTPTYPSTKTLTYKEAVLRRFDEAIAAEKVDAARARLKLQKDWLSKLP